MSLSSRLWDWWARRTGSPQSPPPGPPASAEPARLGVYVYRPAGAAARYYDPMQVRSALNAAYPDWPDAVDQIAKAARPLPDAIQTADPGAEGRRRASAEAATGQLVRACRTAFGLPELDPTTGAGATAGECLAALTGYLDYCAAVMEKTRPL